MLAASTALIVGALSPASAASHTGVSLSAPTVQEFSAAAKKRQRNPYEGRATIYNPRATQESLEPWGPTSRPGLYGGGF
jgi:hypothetical protein